MPIDPRRILIFRQVARAGSVSAGARALGWTQPAVSQHLRNLERECEQSLLLRGATGVTLTEAGERLLVHADAIAAQLGQAEASLAELAAGGGTVAIAAFPSAMADLVPAALAALQQAMPGVSARVIDAEPPEALALVHANEVDLAVVFDYRESVDDSVLERVHLGRDESLLVLPVAHPLAGRTAASLADLADERWVAGCVRCRTHLETLAADAGFAPRIQHETDDYVAAQSFVARTGSVALLPAMAVRAHRRDDVVALQLRDASPRFISVRHRRGAERVPAVAGALRALAAAAAPWSDG